jgi:hypothetical protein
MHEHGYRARLYRGRAEECRRLAEESWASQLRRHFLGMAERYDELARRYEMQVRPRPPEQQTSKPTAKT